MYCCRKKYFFSLKLAPLKTWRPRRLPISPMPGAGPVHSILAYIHTDVYVCMLVYVCICMHVYVCMYMYACICMYVYVCVYVCVYMYVCMYVWPTSVSKRVC